MNRFIRLVITITVISFIRGFSEMAPTGGNDAADGPLKISSVDGRSSIVLDDFSLHVEGDAIEGGPANISLDDIKSVSKAGSTLMIGYEDGMLMLTFDSQWGNNGFQELYSELKAIADENKAAAHAGA